MKNIAEALPNQEGETVVRVLEQMFARHGMPSILLTDQGRNFESHLFASICKLLESRNDALHRTTHKLTDSVKNSTAY